MSAFHAGAHHRVRHLSAARHAGSRRFSSVALALTVMGSAMLPIVFAGCRTTAPQWTLTWEDEFEGSAGQGPDSRSWTFDIGTDWGNGQLEYDTNRPENVALDGAGHLAITARREPWEGQQFTSGRITTLGRFEQRHGRFEARIRMPTGGGLWPAFWMLGNSFPAQGWPASGEIDIVEYRGQEPTRVHGSVHGPGYSAGSALTETFDLRSGRFDTDFHVFAVEWTNTDIVWYVDSTPYHRVRRSDVPGAWVFDEPFYLLLNLAVGGGFVGPPDAGTVFPQAMLVDWVRVYRQES